MAYSEETRNIGNKFNSNIWLHSYVLIFHMPTLHKTIYHNSRKEELEKQAVQS